MNIYMAKMIVDALHPYLTDMQEAFGALRRHFEDVDFAAWSTQDVLDQAEQDGKSISAEDARELLHKIVRAHDAGVGISWDTISEYLSDFPDSREVKSHDAEND